jgi:hypothetical protein
MCLDIVTKRVKKPHKLMTFYKIMRKTPEPEGGFISQHRLCGFHKPQEVGGPFRKCGGGKGRLGYGQRTYPRGFHGYTTKEAARSVRGDHRFLALVECRGHVHTIGRQGGHTVVVAHDMQIVKQIAGCRGRQKAWRRP